MYFYIYISILFCNVCLNNGENITENVGVNVADIAELVISLFRHENQNDSKRIKDLKDKLTKINSYVVDRDKYGELLLKVTRENKLNQTNFYEALLERDYFRLLNNTKNLYSKLKEKINMDDIMKIFDERAKKNVKKSARRHATQHPFLKRQKEKELAEAVDKYLAEIVTDGHRFGDSMSYSQYWDPKFELEERETYQRLKRRRLYRGERTNVRYYPFVVSIQVLGKFWCGGALFWNDLVITSAACLQLVHNNRYYRENANVLTVRVGSNHSRFGGEVIDALEVFFHPSYNPRTLDNNIALIRLQRNIHINHHRVPKLISISYNGEGLPFTAEVLLLGWGVTKMGGKQPYEPTYLQKKILPVYPSYHCKNMYGEKFNSRSMFCAGTVSTGEGACAHDAGGPAILNGKLVGIISYGPTLCGYPDAPTVMTLVGYYADWIETVNETMPGYYQARGQTTTTTENSKRFILKTHEPYPNISELSPDMIELLREMKGDIAPLDEGKKSRFRVKSKAQTLDAEYINSSHKENIEDTSENPAVNKTTHTVKSDVKTEPDQQQDISLSESSDSNEQTGVTVLKSVTSHESEEKEYDLFDQKLPQQPHKTTIKMHKKPSDAVSVKVARPKLKKGLNNNNIRYTIMSAKATTINFQTEKGQATKKYVRTVTNNDKIKREYTSFDKDSMSQNELSELSSSSKEGSKEQSS